VSHSHFDSHIRLINPYHDISTIANLIELCFGAQMDSDGWEYLRQLRRVANNRSAIRYIQAANERAGFPLHGYVWEENGRIIGNVSLTPYYRKGIWRYLIANVAVHPDFRRRGIARALTRCAVEHVREHGVHAAWLQVRADNPGAIHLYQTEGFLERARRTTWQTNYGLPARRELAASTRILPRSSDDWPQQAAWLSQAYPPEVGWNIAFDLEQFSPDLWSSLIRFIKNEDMHHWVIHCQGKLEAVVSWEPTLQLNDHIWLAAAKGSSPEALTALLVHVRRDLGDHHVLVVNYPAGHAEDSLWGAGFAAVHTLIWMENRFDSPEV
jgi:ribosomal protein S18 acetylase RimI-like enzyme